MSDYSPLCNLCGLNSNFECQGHSQKTIEQYHADHLKGIHYMQAMLDAKDDGGSSQFPSPIGNLQALSPTWSPTSMDNKKLGSASNPIIIGSSLSSPQGRPLSSRSSPVSPTPLTESLPTLKRRRTTASRMKLPLLDQDSSSVSDQSDGTSQPTGTESGSVQSIDDLWTSQQVYEFSIIVPSWRSALILRLLRHLKGKSVCIGEDLVVERVGEPGWKVILINLGGDSVFSKDPRSKFFYGYQGQGSVIIDEFRGGIDVAHLLRWFDRYPCNVEIKGCSAPLMASDFWITSNLHPDEWYPTLDAETLAALKRRFFEVVHFE